MTARTLVAIGAFSLLAACGRDDRTAEALAAFDRFQDALFAADASALKRSLTEESGAVADGLPFDRLAGKQRLVAVEAVDQRGCWQVRAEDPNQGGAFADYVVVRERGRFVVDLVASAGLHATERPGDPNAKRALEPRQLTPADYDEIRRRELATPPGERVR